MNDIHARDIAHGNSIGAATNTISLLDLLSVIARRKLLIFVITVTIAVVTVAFLALTLYLPPESRWNLLPNVYRPTVKILLVDSTPTSGISSILGQSGLGALSGLIGTSGFENKANSADLAKALLSSRTIQDEISDTYNFAHRYQLKTNPRTRARGIITKSMTIAFNEKSGIMEIGYQDIDPVFATDVVNTIANLLQNEFRRLTVDKSVSMRLYLEEAIASAEKETATKSAELVAFQNTYGIYDMNAQAQATINAVASQQAQMTAKQLELQLQQKYLPETDARIVRLKDEINAIQKLISQLTEGGTDLTTGTVPQKQMPALGVQYLNLQRDLQVQQSILSVLKQRYETAKLEEMDKSNTFQVMEMAEVPEVRSGPARTATAATVTLVGFLIAIFVAFVAEYISRAKNDPVESEKLSVIRSSFALRKTHPRK